MDAPYSHPLQHLARAQQLSSIYPSYGLGIKEYRNFYVDHIYICEKKRVIGPPRVPIKNWSLEKAHADKYWVPDERYHRHMINVVKSKLKSLGDVSQNRKRNENFDVFPVAYREVEALRDKICDDTVRCSGLAIDGDLVRMTVEKATYFDQLASNISCDIEITHLTNGVSIPSSTFRKMDTESGKLKEFSVCAQANTIGVAVHFVGSDDQLVLRLRGYSAKGGEKPATSQEQLAVMTSGWHPASSGVLTWQDMGEQVTLSGADLFDRLAVGVRREIKEECGDVGDGYTLLPYAFARELERAGKPQFFFVAKFHSLSAREIRASILDRNFVKAKGLWSSVKRIFRRSGTLVPLEGAAEDIGEYNNDVPDPFLCYTFGERTLGFLIPKIDLKNSTYDDVKQLLNDSAQVTYECLGSLYALKDVYSDLNWEGSVNV